jgi:membrane-bound metal-dependent hydrolase YbcI (DUF457 family)
MFIGHFAVAFAAKRAAPRVSLGTLFVACEQVDIVWPVFVLLGIETVRISPGITAFTPLEFVHYPWTHSLLMCAFWAVALGFLYWLLRRETRAAVIVAAVVLSHWFLDAIVHRPDLPLVPGGETRVGLGLWNSIAATLAVEGAMFAAGLVVYLRTITFPDRAGRVGFWILVGMLLLAYFGTAFGPPPPSVEVIAGTGLTGGIVIGVWGYWIEWHTTSSPRR